MNTLQSHAKATLLTANSLLPLAPFHTDLGREKMCCGSPLPEHHSPEPGDPQISAVVPCHGLPSADLCRAPHGFGGQEEIMGDTQSPG